MSPRSSRRARLRARAALSAPLVALALLAFAVSACGLVSTTAPPATPADFPGIATHLARHGIAVSDVVAGDPGCDDRELARTAIRLQARGLDQDEPTTIYAYIFRNRESYERLRSAVDACAAAYVTDPAAFGSVERSPYVIAGPGPWAPEFAAALRRAITEAAGTGG